MQVNKYSHHIKSIQSILNNENLYSVITGSFARHLNGINCSFSDCDLMFKTQEEMVRASECLKEQGYIIVEQKTKEIIMSSDITLDLSYDNYNVLAMPFTIHEDNGLRYFDTIGLLWLSLLDLQGMHYVGYEYPANEKALRELTAHAKKLNLSCSDEMPDSNISKTTKGQSDKRIKVALVNMPFASYKTASLQIGIYKSILNDMDVESDVFYFNRQLSASIGDNVYYSIAEKLRHTFLFEWFFARKTWKNRRHPDNQAFFLRHDELEQYNKIRDKIEQFIDFLISDINWNQYDIVVFPCFEQIVAALCLGKHIKDKYPQILTFYSGEDVFESSAQEYVDKVPWVDVMFVGEIEDSFRQVIYNILRNENFSGIQGIAYKSEQNIVFTGRGHLDDINHSPCPDYGGFFDYVSFEDEVVLPYEASRGCWYGEKKHCTFCSMSDMPFRCKDPDIVYKDICDMYDRWSSYNIERIDFADKILEKSYLNTLLPRFAGKSFRMFFEVKPDLTAHEIKVLFEAGACEIQPGIENFNHNLLKLQNKGVSIAQSISVLKWCKFYDIDIFYNVIGAIPNEQAEWIDDQIEVLNKICHLPWPHLTLTRMQRFSAYHNDGNLDLRPSYAYQFIYPPEIDIDKVADVYDYDLGLTCQKHIAKLKNILASKRNKISIVLRFISKYRILDKRQERKIHTISETQRSILKYYTEPKTSRNPPYSRQDIDDLVNVELLLETEGKIVSLVEIEEDDLQFCQPKIKEYKKSPNLNLPILS